jgi:hypothetical protein
MNLIPCLDEALNAEVAHADLRLDPFAVKRSRSCFRALAVVGRGCCDSRDLPRGNGSWSVRSRGPKAECLSRWGQCRSAAGQPHPILVIELCTKVTALLHPQTLVCTPGQMQEHAEPTALKCKARPLQLGMLDDSSAGQNHCYISWWS